MARDQEMVAKYLEDIAAGKNWDTTLKCGLPARGRASRFAGQTTLYEQVMMNMFAYASVILSPSFLKYILTDDLLLVG